MSYDKLYKMDFYKVYDCLLKKVERKGRSQAELDEVIRWLTGYGQSELERMKAQSIDYETFFVNAPKLNENRHMIKGLVCKVRVEDIVEPLAREIRYLDKLVDELAKGKSMDKILRK